MFSLEPHEIDYETLFSLSCFVWLSGGCLAERTKAQTIYADGSKNFVGSNPIEIRSSNGSFK